MSVSLQALPRYARRNWLAFLGDYLTMGLGFTFASTSTTLPAFAAALTDEKVLIGAVSSVWLGGWLLPQVFLANALSHLPRKYPVMMWGMLLGRPAFPLFVLWLLVSRARQPTLTLYVFLGMLAVFMLWDALVALAWFDLAGKALKPQARGRLFGLGQAVTGVSALGAGAWIRYLLGPGGPPFPVNYAIIFGLASTCFCLSIVACAFIVEPDEAVQASRARLRDYFPQLARLWRDDLAFRRITLVRLLAGLGGLATPFYVVYATDVLRLPAASIGWFAGASTLGGAIAGIVLGTVADRSGSQRVVQITSSLYLAVPLLALVLRTSVFASLAPFLYPVLYVLLGMFEGSILLGFLNFILEIAPPGQRPVYMGLTNTIAGVLVLVPLLGGFLLDRTSYPVVFGLAAVGILAGALLSFKLPNPRLGTSAPPMPEVEAQTSPAP